ncbi:MAG: hypothetical protein WCG10_00130, partial [Chlamydiota bacterium]
MKNSPHHNKHLKHQAIKEANAMGNTPQKGLENPEFKKKTLVNPEPEPEPEPKPEPEPEPE